MVAASRIMQPASAAAVAIGAIGALLPRQFAVVYGYRAADDLTGHLTRLLSTRNAALGVIGLTAAGRAEARELVAVLAGLNFVDALFGLRAGSGLPRRTRTLQVVTSGAFLAASAAALTAEQ